MTKEELELKNRVLEKLSSPKARYEVSHREDCLCEKCTEQNREYNKRNNTTQITEIRF